MPHPLSHPKMLTTGVLNTVVGQTAAHIEVVNLEAHRSANVTILVIDWNTGSPVILFNQSLTMLPNTFMSFSQALAQFHYEIRLILPAHLNVTANTFAINASASTLPGLTMTEKDMKHLH
ncbi:hypothetical protein ACFPES_06250 [Paenibacillus sp. GCM10023248]|uniref:hypothetical protein n=1 Tax=Bacillales TaxID=1385 RepID=UPI002378DA4D|nr:MULTISPECIES: hypothetical protein [Bacillales]MDD9266630.1 hypothetical protein [Paenibacillus sp. MAHUQ-63]MDR6878751.1 hypothetical protein [Bacillus sp. 3255]